MGYIRRNIYLGLDQNNTLESLKELSVSEHVRRAIDDYIVKIKNQKATTSSSKKGGQNDE